MGFKLETQRSSGSSGYQSSSTDSQPGPGGGEAGSHRCLAVLQGHEGHVFSLALAGEVLYSGSDCGEVRAWRAAEELQQSVGRFGSGEGSVKAMVVEGQRVFSAHQDQKIRVWKRSRGGAHKLVATLPTAKDYVMSCMTPKNYVQVRRHKKALWIDHHDTISVLAVGKSVLYSGSWDKTIKVWRLSDLKCMESISAHADAVNALVVDPKRGFLYSGSADGTVKVWERGRTGATHHSLVTILEAKPTTTINALALSDDGTVCYAAASDKCVAVWETHDAGTVKHMRIAGALRGHRLAVLCLASAADLLISGSADKTIRVWTRRRGNQLQHHCIAVIAEHLGPVKCVAAAMQRTGAMVYSGSMDRSVRAWWVSDRQRDEDEEEEEHSSSSSADEFLSPMTARFPSFAHACRKA